MHAQGEENHSRAEIKLMITKQASCTGAPICPIKTLHVFMEGVQGPKTDVFSCTGKRVWRLPEGADLDSSIYRFAKIVLMSIL